MAKNTVWVRNPRRGKSHARLMAHPDQYGVTGIARCGYRFTYFDEVPYEQVAPEDRCAHCAVA